MRRDTRSKVLWASWMTGGALVLTVVAWVLTESVAWALVALVAAGPILNAVGQMIVQPMQAVSRSARPRNERGRAR